MTAGDKLLAKPYVVSNNGTFFYTTLLDYRYYFGNKNIVLDYAVCYNASIRVVMLSIAN